MHRGGWRYRKVLAALDEEGITANIVRVGSKRFELHVNYEIVKTARNRVTCNRHLTRLLHQSTNPPIHQSTNPPIHQSMPITANSSWVEIFGSNIREFTPEQREANWRAWEKAAGQEATEHWRDLEACEGCIHLDADRYWCRLQELPNTYNPVLKMFGMACMGAGKETETDLSPNSNSDMKFFQQLSDASEGDIDLTLQVSIKRSMATISAMPQNFKFTQAFYASGTIAEMDEGFFAALKVPLDAAAAAGLKTNSAELVKEIETPAKGAPAGKTADKAKPEPKKREGNEKTPAGSAQNSAGTAVARVAQLTGLGFDHDEALKQYFINVGSVSRIVSQERIDNLRNPDWNTLITEIEKELREGSDESQQSTAPEKPEQQAAPAPAAAAPPPPPAPPRPAPPAPPAPPVANSGNAQ